MQVTVAAGHTGASLTYNVADRAYTQAQQLAQIITRTFGSTGTSYNPASPPVTPANGGYLYDLAPNGQTIKATGFQAVVVQNNSGAATVVGGGNYNQTVLGGNGGLTFTDTNDAWWHNTTVALGGGNNSVNFSGSQGFVQAYTDSGNNTIVGGVGETLIDAGVGNNTVSLGGGNSAVIVEGHDNVYLGSGNAVIAIDTVPGANATVHGSSSSSYLLFENGSAASTVTAGAGTDYVYGSVGGGVFTGGSAGGNVLLGGSGAVTLFGGGAYDYLQGGSNGNNSIKAAGGNSTLVASAAGSDTLVAGTGKDTINLVSETAGKNYTVGGYSTNDLLLIDQANAGSATIPGADKVSGGNSVITLSDNTKITLTGYTGALNVGSPHGWGW
jgi:Ca2+-binding RTX toxin-like protein